MAHIGMGNIYEWGRWDYINAEKEYLKFLDLQPNNEVFNSVLIVDFLIKMNRLEDAESKRKYLGYQGDNFRIQILLGNKQEALDSIYQYLEINRLPIEPWIGEILIWLEEYDSAVIYLNSPFENQAEDLSIPRWSADYALALSKTGDHQKAKKLINQLIDKSHITSVGSPAYFIGWYYSGIIEVDSAFYWLEKAYENRSPEFPHLKVNPIFNSLKEDDRYWNLYERTGHKAYDDYMKLEGIRNSNNL
jgi:tetratricopeptide (TPR) repeat protein